MTTALILHVGPHKTGTTALQQALAENAGRLMPLGILYPQTGRAGMSHPALAEACRTGDGAMLHALAAEAEGWRTVILSSENFSMLDSRALAELRALFPRAEIRVPYTLRRLATLWPAHWAELVKHGQEPGFDAYLDRVAARDDTPFRAPVLPLRQLQRLADAFGRDALRILLHEARGGPGQDIGPAFIDDLLGLGQEAPHFATTRVNITPTAQETALVRLMNLQMAGRATYLEKQALRLALLDALREGPPDWLADFDAALGRARRLVLSSSLPLVASEQAEVVKLYGDLMLDAPEDYLSPVETAVSLFGPADLPPGLRAEIAAFIEGLPRQPRADGPW